MAISSLHTLYAVDINTTLVDQVTDQSIDVNTAHFLQGGDGSVYKTFAAVNTITPTIGFTTTAIKTLLDKITVGGLKVTSGAVLTAFLQQVDEGATRKGASAHTKIIVNEGLVYPVTVSASQGAPAQASAMVACTYDGSNLPLAITEGQSLTGTPTVDNMWTLGPATVFGNAVTGVQSVSIDFGITLFLQAGDGQIYNTFVAVNEQTPTISIETTDVGLLADLTLVGDASSTAVCYLTHVTQGGTRVINATETHISFTVNEGRAFAEAITGSDGSILGTRIGIIPTHDGTNAPIVVDTTAAIA